MDLVKRRREAWLVRNEADRKEALARLRQAVSEVLPGESLYVYGSVLRPGRFTGASDVDIALLATPPGTSVYRIQAELTDRLRRTVDVCILDETRLKSRIECEGELWTS